MNDVTGTDSYSAQLRAAVVWGAALGVVAFVFILFFVFATGMTHGQRCAEIHPKLSPEWRACVNELSGGANADQ